LQLPCLIRAPCASCALCSRVLGLETTVRAPALALALCVSAARQLHCTCGSADARMIPCRSYRRCLCLVSFCANYCRPPVKYFRPVLTARRRHSRGSSLFVCAQTFLTSFLSLFRPGLYLSLPVDLQLASWPATRRADELSACWT